MKPISFKRHRFPADVIRQAVWPYYRFTLSYHDVEGLLAQQGGVVVSGWSLGGSLGPFSSLKSPWEGLLSTAL